MNSRIRLIRRELNLTQEEFARKIGVKKSIISMIETGKSTLTLRNKDSIVHFLNINPRWLESGKESMFSPPTKPIPQCDIEHKTGEYGVPIYSVNKTVGIAALFKDKTARQPMDHIYIPNLPSCDGAIHIVGDGMYPILNSGDIVLYKQTERLEDVLWGYMHLLSIDRGGEEFVTVQYLHKSDKPGCIKLTSENQRYSDVDIDVGKILAIAFVKATIRINSI